MSHVHQILDMSKRKADSEIARGDCPLNPAAAYPGKYGRNNRGGSVLTKEKFKEEAVRCWIEHFGESEKFENTPLGNKASYLAQHLKALKVNAKEARALIVRVESDQTREVAEQERGNPLVEVGEGEGEEEGEEEGAGGGNVNEEQMEVGDNWGQSSTNGGGGEEEDMDCDGDEEDNQDFDKEDVAEDSDDVSSEENRVAIEFEVRKFMYKSDHELFNSGLEIPTCVTKSAKFKERRREFIKTYIEEKDFQDSQEVLEALGQAPPVVEDCLKQRLSHLTKQEKASRLITQTLSDTLLRLKETPGREARNQVQVILAAVTHHRLNIAYYQFRQELFPF